MGTGYISKETLVHRAGPVEDSIADGRTFEMINPSRCPFRIRCPSHRSDTRSSPSGVKYFLPSRAPGTGGGPSSQSTRSGSPNIRTDNCSQPATTHTSPLGAGIKSWTDKPGYFVDEDIVIWHTFWFNHIPRVEDFPIMPAETAQMHRKPYNSCEYNPTNDVPPSN